VAQMAEMTRERGLAISPSCVWRWVQTYGPELDKRCRRHRKPTNRSGRVAETYIKVKGQERFRYRAVDSSGQTIAFLLTAKRDTAAAKRFYQRGMANPGNSLPRVINVDQNRAYPAAVAELTSCSASPRKKPFNSASSRPSLLFATESCNLKYLTHQGVGLSFASTPQIRRSFTGLSAPLPNAVLAPTILEAPPSALRLGSRPPSTSPLMPATCGQVRDTDSGVQDRS
jgi:transposase, IS6 family